MDDSNSPLQSLKQQLKQTRLAGRERIFDRESIYSFDSVSTNGRLLDRLGLDDEVDENDYDDKRQSYYEDQKIKQTKVPKQPLMNIRSSSSNVNNFRYPQQRQLRPPSNVHVRYAPMNLVLENTNTSLDSIESDKAMFKKTVSSNDSIPLSSTSSSSASSLETTRPSTKESEVKDSPKMHKRTLSETMLNSDLTAEERTALALQLRTMGKHREASYQLQIASNEPYNYPRAMFLYAMMLKYGQGVKQNDNHSIKWLCKSVLISSNHLTPDKVSAITDKLNLLTADEIIQLVVKNLHKTNDKDALHNGQNVQFLHQHFRKLSKAQISKIVNVSNKKLDTIACSYHELGNNLLHGVGLSQKDELSGIILLSKAGSMGYIPSMTQLGEIYTTKTKSRKKDLIKAAGWLRLGELFGVISMGNSWIHKEKYMQ